MFPNMLNAAQGQAESKRKRREGGARGKSSEGVSESSDVSRGGTQKKLTFTEQGAAGAAFSQVFSQEELLQSEDLSMEDKIKVWMTDYTPCLTICLNLNNFADVFVHGSGRSAGNARLLKHRFVSMSRTLEILWL